MSRASTRSTASEEKASIPPVKEFDAPEPPAEDAEDAQNGTSEAPGPDSAGEDTAEDTTERQNGLRKAYGVATARLREKHRTEFDTLYVAAARELGIEYKPKPTPEQKAEAELEALFTQFPHLREKAKADLGTED